MRLKNKQQGATLVEMTIVFPIFLLLIFGVIILFFSFYQFSHAQFDVDKVCRDLALVDTASGSNGNLACDEIFNNLYQKYGNFSVRYDTANAKLIQGNGEEQVATDGMCEILQSGHRVAFNISLPYQVSLANIAFGILKNDRNNLFTVNSFCYIGDKL